ncbi:LPXTG cell wall anchor domain-containing protein, partial [Corynebacterium ulcerans]
TTEPTSSSSTTTQTTEPTSSSSTTTKTTHAIPPIIPIPIPIPVPTVLPPAPTPTVSPNVPTPTATPQAHPSSTAPQPERGKGVLAKTGASVIWMALLAVLLGSLGGVLIYITNAKKKK